VALGNRQPDIVQQLDPAFEGGRFYVGTFVSLAMLEAIITALTVPGVGQIGFSPELAIVWRSFADK
jgi:hypothetical protein